MLLAVVEVVFNFSFFNHQRDVLLFLSSRKGMFRCSSHAKGCFVLLVLTQMDVSLFLSSRKWMFSCCCPHAEGCLAVLVFTAYLSLSWRVMLFGSQTDARVGWMGWGRDSLFLLSSGHCVLESDVIWVPN